MATATAQRLVTAAELLHLPDPGDGVRFELVSGVLVRMSPSSVRSNAISIRIAHLMLGFVDDHDLGAVGGSEGGFRLKADPDTVRAPDVWFIRKDRIPAGGIPDDFWPGAPDLAAEVLSPTDRTADIWRRVGEYLEAGARLVWVLDPKTQSAVAFPADSLPVIIPADGVLDGGAVLPGFVLPLREVFGA